MVDRVSAVVLAGGLGRRMGRRDKGLVEVAGQPLIAHVVDRLAPGVDEFIISCNRHLDEYARYGTPVRDAAEGFRGPLAGIASAVPHASHALCLVVPCDMPDLPTDLCARLRQGLGDHDAAFVHDGRRSQHLVMIVRKEAIDGIASRLQGGDKSVKGWIDVIDAVAVDFSDCPDSFRNVNRLD